MARSRTTGRARKPAGKVPRGLNPARHRFALEYLRNGFNATQAYRTAYPGAAYRTAMQEGYRLLRFPEVRAFLGPKLEEFWAQKTADAETVLARLAGDATADIRRLFDEDGKLLPPHDWPEDVASSIEAVEVRDAGGLKIKLVSKLGARRTLLEVYGKLRSGADESVDKLVEALDRTLERNKGTTKGK